MNQKVFQPSCSHFPYSAASLVERRTPSQRSRNSDREACQMCPTRGKKVKSECASVNQPLLDVRKTPSTRSALGGANVKTWPSWAFRARHLTSEALWKDCLPRTPPPSEAAMRRDSMLNRASARRKAMSARTSPASSTRRTGKVSKNAGMRRASRIVPPGARKSTWLQCCKAPLADKKM